MWEKRKLPRIKKFRNKRNFFLGDIVMKTILHPRRHALRHGRAEACTSVRHASMLVVDTE